MQIPSSLKNAIDGLLGSIKQDELIEAREELTERYRGYSSQYMRSESHRKAYIASRMPATYAAVHAALQAIKERNQFGVINSVCDLGAGPGTASWAACDLFPEIRQVTMLEKDSALSEMGKQLAQESEFDALRSAEWIMADLEQISLVPDHDLILLSYSIGELKAEKILSLIDHCWQAANKILLIVEPGTPVGFERIRLIRRHLIELGGNLIAPCPGHMVCPMVGGNWCHFSARVERSVLQRKLKGGVLGYEDEKFSYVAASKFPVTWPEGRVLRHPQRHSGHIEFVLCTRVGLREVTASKKWGDTYKQAKKLEWGDSWDLLEMV